MYRIPGAFSSTTTTPTRAVVPQAGPAEASPGQAEDRKRIALGLNDVVVRRLLTAGQDLQAALGLMGNHAASGKIRHAVDEMDQAVRDIPDTVFDHPAGERPPLDTSTSTT
jgi:hypothetical protein